MINNIKRKLLDNRYICAEVMEKTFEMKPGIKRRLYRIGGCAVSLLKHRFNLWDYQHEIDFVKKNNFIYSFEKYGKTITMYLPHYEEDYLQKNIVECSHFYEESRLAFLKKHYLEDGYVILDIGANIGNHTVFFSKICNAQKVYAFEPIDETYYTLCRNISLNHIEDTVVAYNVALGNVLGKAKIKKFSPNSIGSTQVEAADDGNISMKRLDDYEFERIDFIKIDVETYEYDLLLGAKNTLSKHSPIIFIEIFKENFVRVDKLLRSYGYFCDHSYSQLDSLNYIYKKAQQ